MRIKKYSVLLLVMAMLMQSVSFTIIPGIVGSVEAASVSQKKFFLILEPKAEFRLNLLWQTTDTVHP